jgi:hypothetical protein
MSAGLNQPFDQFRDCAQLKYGLDRQLNGQQLPDAGDNPNGLD